MLGMICEPPKTDPYYPPVDIDVVNHHLQVIAFGKPLVFHILKCMLTLGQVT